jgi:hypothetical protein
VLAELGRVFLSDEVDEVECIAESQPHSYEWYEGIYFSLIFCNFSQMLRIFFSLGKLKRFKPIVP